MTDWLRIYHPDPAAWTPRIAEATQAIAAAGGWVMKTDVRTSAEYCGASVFLTWCRLGPKERNDDE